MVPIILADYYFMESLDKFVDTVVNKISSSTKQNSSIYPVSL